MVEHAVAAVRMALTAVAVGGGDRAINDAVLAVHGLVIEECASLEEGLIEAGRLTREHVTLNLQLLLRLAEATGHKPDTILDDVLARGTS